MQLKIISDSNINLLKKFISNKLSNKFRYFDKRDLGCIKNHLITLIGVINDEPVAYGHIDIESNKHWLGICILDNYQGKGYGKKIMDELIYQSQNVKEIFLTVDKDNINAINLYKKYEFNIIKEKATYYLMRRICSKN